MSLDAGKELHVERQNEKLLQQLLSLKEAGGTEMALVNSVFTEDNHDDVVALGRSICSSGIDQWGIAPLLASRQRRLFPAVSLDSIKVLL